jgi:hypothetical protein
VVLLPQCLGLMDFLGNMFAINLVRTRLNKSLLIFSPLKVLGVLFALSLTVVVKWKFDTFGKCSTTDRSRLHRNSLEKLTLFQLALMPFSPRDENSIYEAVKRSDVVINLIGKDYATRHATLEVNYSLEDTLVNIPETIARISKKAGVKSLIHVSALAADKDSASEWARCKARSEEVVRKHFPESVGPFPPHLGVSNHPRYPLLTSVDHR